jgi:hypothetical protein
LAVTSLRKALIVVRATIEPPTAPWMAILNCWRGMVSARRSHIGSLWFRRKAACFRRNAAYINNSH